jgi:hypothetical protein
VDYLMLLKTAQVLEYIFILLNRRLTASASNASGSKSGPIYSTVLA